MDKHISVIIPIYNAESTIQRCLNSLLKSIDEDIEVILVNDGSIDKSEEICLSYSHQYTNIHYFKKENGGVSSARNFGLNKATGSYITFVDSDDYVANDYFSTIKKIISLQGSDLIQFSYVVLSGNGSRTVHFNEVLHKNRSALMPDIINSICRKYINSPCNKVYKHSIIDNHLIRFPEGVSIAEDRVFNINYTFYINSYSTVDHPLYYVNTSNENSLSRGIQKDLKKQNEITNDYFNKTLEKAPIQQTEKDQYIRAMNFGVCRSVYHGAKLLYRDQLNWLQRQRKIRSLCKNINRRKMKYPNTLYCNLISLPVRWNLSVVIDVIAWRIAH